MILKLTPSSSKRIGQSWEVIHPGLGNSTINRIFSQSEVTNQHSRAAKRLIEWIRVIDSTAKCLKLNIPCRALDLCPVVVKQAS
jgi:hypothetical protein